MSQLELESVIIYIHVYIYRERERERERDRESERESVTFYAFFFVYVAIYKFNDEILKVSLLSLHHFNVGNLRIIMKHHISIPVETGPAP